MTNLEIEEKLRSFRPSKNFPRRLIYERQILPVAETDSQIVVATSSPDDPDVIRLLTYLLQKEILWVTVDRKNILNWIKSHYGIGSDTIDAMMEQEEWREIVSETVDQHDLKESEASIIQFVNQVIREAHQERATDIHFEPMEKSLRLRYRVDGALRQVPISSDAKHFESAIISRIKVMSGMDIAEKRLPQDGRLRVKWNEEELDVRVSTIPTAHGESVSLRLLARRDAILRLEHVGFSLRNREVLRSFIHRPHGIILLTGPTGCGKSSTLYACLNEINREELRIVTIEDPIERDLVGVNQIQVRHDIDFDFAKGLRHILRQDPDVIMVGEIRDYETAEIAIRASLTGHLVFSTLHTNDAPGSVTRLIDMGVEPFLVASSLKLVIAQRLVRKICSSCGKPLENQPWLMPRDRDFLEEKLSDNRWSEGAGCEICSQTGFLGRTAIHEFMLMNESLRSLVLSRAPSSAIRTAAVQEGMITLHQDGLLKASQGITTVEEVLRVTEGKEG